MFFRFPICSLGGCPFVCIGCTNSKMRSYYSLPGSVWPSNVSTRSVFSLLQSSYTTFERVNRLSGANRGTCQQAPSILFFDGMDCIMTGRKLAVFFSTLHQKLWLHRWQKLMLTRQTCARGLQRWSHPDKGSSMSFEDWQLHCDFGWSLSSVLSLPNHHLYQSLEGVAQKIVDAAVASSSVIFI